jgi:hypothetical protein
VETRRSMLALGLIAARLLGVRGIGSSDLPIPENLIAVSSPQLIHLAYQ